ncbi:hypothetical protein V6N13_092666 [Hibiscus sabdariffa]
MGRRMRAEEWHLHVWKWRWVRQVSNVKVPDTLVAQAQAVEDMSIGLKQCEEKCLRNCSCVAYASANSETNGGTGCLTWQRKFGGCEGIYRDGTRSIHTCGQN